MDIKKNLKGETKGLRDKKTKRRRDEERGKERKREERRGRDKR